MESCPHCGSSVEERFRFCPWCASPLRRKLVEFFRAHPRDAGKALRVSRYVDDTPQVRFSVWDEAGRVEAAVSLEDPEANRLARFLRPRVPRRRQRLSAVLAYAAGVSARRSSTGSRKVTSS